jgi:hypothetical protein
MTSRYPTDTFDKTIGDVSVHVTAPFPRFVNIRYKQGNQSIRTLTLSEIRNLKDMLESALEFAAEDED